jgi:hypothetical protein
MDPRRSHSDAPTLGNGLYSLQGGSAVQGHQQLHDEAVPGPSVEDWVPGFLRSNSIRQQQEGSFSHQTRQDLPQDHFSNGYGELLQHGGLGAGPSRNPEAKGVFVPEEEGWFAGYGQRWDWDDTTATEKLFSVPPPQPSQEGANDRQERIGEDGEGDEDEGELRDPFSLLEYLKGTL